MDSVSSRVWLCFFGSGYKYRLRDNVKDISINIKLILLLFASTYFSATSSICIFFFLRVLIDSTSCIASVRPSTILEFRVSTSWLWLPGVSLLSGLKYSSYHPCRLIGQIDWHTLDIRLGISPLCLQIHFCINRCTLVLRLAPVRMVILTYHCHPQ
jgi:hypothetical protein